MQILAIIVLFLAVLVLLVSALYYKKVLAYFRQDEYSGKMYTTWLYELELWLLLLFVVAYCIVGMFFVLGEKAVSKVDMLVAFILLLGSLFTLLVVHTQLEMIRSLTHKSNELIRSLVCTIEAKDPYTIGHSMHVLNLVELLYQHLPYNLQKKVNTAHLRDSAILHDIGKIGIPDVVLNKAGPLMPEEWQSVYQHSYTGKKIVGGSSYQQIGKIIQAHHERVDGKGYLKLPLEKIPIEARMIAVADTYSALTTDRAYRPRKSHEEAIEVLHQVAGTQLDARLVAVFVKLPKEKIERTVYYEKIA